MKGLQVIESDAAAVVSRLDLSVLKNKTILITGASGLLGTHFLATLREYAKTMPNLKVIALTHAKPEDFWTYWFDSKMFTYLQGDLSDPAFVSSLPSVDFIIHAAGFGQPGKFLQDSVKTIELNTTATSGLFRKLSPGGRLLFVSTSEVYVGGHSDNPKESDIGQTNTDWIRAPYIEAKRCGEALCHAYSKQGKESKIIRLALGYGPGTKLNDHRVLHSFIERALSQRKIELMDHGLAKRTYCYISDAVEMIWNAFLHGKESVYNIGGDSRTSVGELAKIIGKILDVPVIFPPMPELTPDLIKGAPSDVKLDLSRIMSEFKKYSFVGLEEGLKRTIAWQSALQNIEKFKTRETVA